MKIGVSSYSFNRYLKETKCGYRALFDISKKIGFTGLEFIDLVSPAWGIEGDANDLAREVRGYADEFGMEIPAYTVGANFQCDDPAREVERICRQLDVAKILGAPVFRHDATFRLREGNTWERGIEEMAPFIRQVTEYGASLGIRTCTENHGYIYQAPERVKALIEAVGHPNYGWLVDIGNFTVVDYDNLKAVRIAAPYAFHVHAKDFVYKPDPGAGHPVPGGFNRSAGGNLWRGTVLGHGAVPVEACLSALIDAGYIGYFSLEFEGAEDNLPALENGFAYLRDCLQK